MVVKMKDPGLTDLEAGGRTYIAKMGGAAGGTLGSDSDLNEKGK